MNKIIRKSLIIILLIFSSVMIMNVVTPGATVQAATKKSKAITEYKKFLSQNSVKYDNETYNMKNCSFALAYVDKDSVPELILYNVEDTDHAVGYGKLYTYRKGKVQLVKGLQINGSKFYYYKKTGIYLDDYSGMGYKTKWYNKLGKGNSKTVLTISEELSDENRDGKLSKGYSNSKVKLTKKKFNKKLKKYVGKKKKKVVKFRKNTRANRVKYLK